MCWKAIVFKTDTVSMREGRLSSHCENSREFGGSPVTGVTAQSQMWPETLGG